MNKLNALVVDNDYEIRHLLVDFLQQHDFTVSQANNTEEADKQIAKQKPDVILLDLKCRVKMVLVIVDVFEKDLINPL